MFGLKFMGEVPFRDVYITGMFRDAERQKMSKSKGNVVDPLEICDQYGTDAVRFALARLGAPGTDITLTEDSLESYRNFATKIWNAARFILRYVDEARSASVICRVQAGEPVAVGSLDSCSPGTRANEANSSPDDQYNLHEASRTIYRFFWHEFCDWYLEMIKLHPERSKPVLLYVFESALRLLHPFMPFHYRRTVAEHSAQRRIDRDRRVSGVRSGVDERGGRETHGN